LQGDVLIEVEEAVTGLVSPGGVVMEAVQERQELPEVLEALKLIVGDGFPPRHCHGGDDAPKPPRAQVKILLILCGFAVQV
jgi:hypothetical protein